MTTKSVAPFALRALGPRQKRRRLVEPEAPPPATQGASSAAHAHTPFLDDSRDLATPQEEQDAARMEKVEQIILESLDPTARRRSSGSQQPPKKVYVAPQPSEEERRRRPTSLRVKLLPQFFCIEGLGYALPYSATNQKFVQMLEQARMPWDHLRSVPELRRMCEGKYHEGSLAVDVADKRSPAATEAAQAAAKERRCVLRMDDDSFLQDLHEFTDAKPFATDFKLRLEALLLSRIAPAPCLISSPLVARIYNVLQYNRLKFNSPGLRVLASDPMPPLPLKRPRYGPATCGTWVHSQNSAAAAGGAQAAGGAGADGGKAGKRQRKLTPAAAENLRAKQGGGGKGGKGAAAAAAAGGRRRRRRRRR